MYCIVGLGNPGKQYEKTRHNAGAMALEEFLDIFPNYKILNDQKSSAFIIEEKYKDKKIILAFPQTFMNQTGTTVKKLLKKYYIQDTKYLIVIHDDIDIPLGEIKVSEGRGSAGHKGIDSIIQALGTKNFTRVRIGIQPVSGKPEDVEDFVLRNFKKSELTLLESAIQKTVGSLKSLLG